MNPLVAYALRYPFDVVSSSCLYVNGRTFPYAQVEPSDPWAGIVLDDGAAVRAADLVERLTGWRPGTVEDRVPVLAYGSNGAPESLVRKFANFTGPVVVPFLMVDLADFDVCFSAHLTSYGSIPATLCRSPGTRIRVPVTLLSEALLTHLNGTEALGRNYRFVRLERTDAQVDGARAFDTLTAYVSLWGPLERGGLPIALGPVRAQGRTLRAGTERDALAHAARRLGGGHTIEDLVHGAVDDPMTRLAWSCALASRTAPRTRPLLSSA